MIAVDTNVLVYAYREDSPFHERARRVHRIPCQWLRSLGDPLALPA